MQNVGLVLEGGGMRGIYTAGALDFFLERQITFPYVIGVSAGACNAASYVSGQKGRNKIVNTAFVNDWRYMSIKNLVLNGSLFGMDYIFDEIPQRKVPFDFDAFYRSPIDFRIGVTDCRQGKAKYFCKNDMDKKFTALRASCSLPLISPIIQFHELELLDGGICDPIPINKAIQDGYENNVVILTRNKGYQKKALKYQEKLLYRFKYKKYPNLLGALEERYKRYNASLRFIDDLEAKGRVMVIRPTQKLEVGRFEKNKGNLLNLYFQGYQNAKEKFQAKAKGFC